MSDSRTTRQAVERRSAPALLWLHRQPRWFVPMVAAGLLVAGLAVQGAIGAASLGVLALALAWLAVLSWPRLSPAGRALRFCAVAAVVAIAASRIFG